MALTSRRDITEGCGKLTWGTPTAQCECGQGRLWESGLGAAPPRQCPPSLPVSDWAWGQKEKQRLGMPKVTGGAPSPPRETAPGSQGQSAEGSLSISPPVGLGEGQGWGLGRLDCPAVSPCARSWPTMSPQVTAVSLADWPAEEVQMSQKGGLSWPGGDPQGSGMLWDCPWTHWGAPKAAPQGVEIDPLLGAAHSSGAPSPRPPAPARTASPHLPFVIVRGSMEVF